MKRRDFLTKSVLAAGALTLPIDVIASNLRSKNIEIGIIADIHQDVMHDGEQRLQKFIDEAKKRNPDFIIQMGDFCRPYDYNKPFMNIWNSFNGGKHHVIGNHDMDGGFSRDAVKAFWDMPANYYSFDKGGLHFIILDGNDQNPKPWSGYKRYIGKQQQEWLKADLANTNKQTIIFSHQTLELEDGGVANLKEFFNALEFKEEQTGGVCLCSGTYRLRISKEGKVVANINYQHHIALRWGGKSWIGDSSLTEDSTNVMLHWFAKHGFKDPLEDYTQTLAARKASIDRAEFILSHLS